MTNREQYIKLYTDKIAELEEQLAEMKSVHLSIAKDYGSELCSEDMIRKEEFLQEEIEHAKIREKEEAKQFQIFVKQQILDFNASILKVEENLKNCISDNSIRNCNILITAYKEAIKIAEKDLEEANSFMALSNND